MAALAALWLNPVFPITLQLALSVALVTGLADFLIRHSRGKSAGVVTELAFRSGSWMLLFNDGQWQPARLTGPLHVGYLFVILGFKLKREKLKVVIGRDTCEDNAYRRLTVFCRFHGPKLLQAPLGTSD